MHTSIPPSELWELRYLHRSMMLRLSVGRFAWRRNGVCVANLVRIFGLRFNLRTRHPQSFGSALQPAARVGATRIAQFFFL